MLMTLPLLALGAAAAAGPVGAGGAALEKGVTAGATDAFAGVANAAQSYGGSALGAVAARAQQGAQGLVDTFRDPVRLGTAVADETGKALAGGAMTAAGYLFAKFHDASQKTAAPVASGSP